MDLIQKKNKLRIPFNQPSHMNSYLDVAQHKKVSEEASLGTGGQVELLD